MLQTRLGVAQSHRVLLHWARVLVTQSDSFLFLSSPHSRKLTAKGALCSQESLTPQQITDLKPFPETYGWIMPALCLWMWDCPFLPLSCLQPAGVQPGPRCCARPNTAPTLAHSHINCFVSLIRLEVLERGHFLTLLPFFVSFLKTNYGPWLVDDIQ